MLKYLTAVLLLLFLFASPALAGDDPTRFDDSMDFLVEEGLPGTAESDIDPTRLMEALEVNKELEQRLQEIYEQVLNPEPGFGEHAFPEYPEDDHVDSEYDMNL